MFVESVWDTLSLQLRYLISGTSKVFRSRMGLILDLSPSTLEKVLYFASYIVLDKGETELQYKQILSERSTRKHEKWGKGIPCRYGC